MNLLYWVSLQGQFKIPSTWFLIHFAFSEKEITCEIASRLFQVAEKPLQTGRGHWVSSWGCSCLFQAQGKMQLLQGSGALLVPAGRECWEPRRSGRAGCGGGQHGRTGLYSPAVSAENPLQTLNTFRLTLHSRLLPVWCIPVGARCFWLSSPRREHGCCAPGLLLTAMVVSGGTGMQVWCWFALKWQKQQLWPWKACHAMDCYYRLSYFSVQTDLHIWLLGRTAICWPLKAVLCRVHWGCT